MWHEPSEIILIFWFGAWLLLVINNVVLLLLSALERVLLINILVETVFVCFFSMIIWSIKSSKEQHLFEIEIFWNIVNVLIVTFEKTNKKNCILTE